MIQFPIKARFLAVVTGLAATSLSAAAHAVSSAEFYSAKSYQYGRVEARIQFAAGDGVVSSFFLWKDGSEKAGTFWNELDFEKLGADCHLETNAYYGNPAVVHSQKPVLTADLCGGFHSYTYEWTPEYIAWLVDGVEIRRETGAAATAYSDNTTAGMQIRFNIWPGNASFGGNFSPAILPVYQYVNWVEYSSYADGAFKLEWREDFSATTLPAGWLTGNWSSPKNLSTHSPGNVGVVDGYLVLSLTADNALGSVGATPADNGSTPILASTGGTTGAGGMASGAASGVGGVNAAQSTGIATEQGGCSLVSPRARMTRTATMLLGFFAGAFIVRRKRTIETKWTRKVLELRS